MVIWIIGLSGAGKTTIGRQVYKKLKSNHANTVLIDGDEIRDIFKNDQLQNDYSIHARKQNADRICAMCKWLDNQDINVVCCILSLFEESRNWNKLNYSNYFEVYIRVPIDFLKKNRDYKGIYARADQGRLKSVVGVDIPFSEPLHSDMVIDNTIEKNSFDEIANDIIKQCSEKWELEE